MIQRVQTIYLLLAAMLTGAMLCLPIASFLAGGQEYHLTPFGLTSAAATETPAIQMLCVMGWAVVLAILVPLITIFLFKKRPLQMRLCLAEIVLLIGVQALVLYFTRQVSGSLEGFSGGSWSFSIAAVFPIVSIIFTILARRAIAQDEKLVRSTDRIR